MNNLGSLPVENFNLLSYATRATVRLQKVPTLLA